MNDEPKLIFDWIGTLPVLVPQWEKRLPLMYQELNAKWFQGSLPTLTNDFVCEFCDMPQDTEGIYLDEKTAEAQSTPEVRIRPGIRVNSAPKVLTDHVKIALHHEMIHVCGVTGHLQPFNLEVSRLMLAGRYIH